MGKVIGARLGLIDQTPPSGLVEPAVCAFDVFNVPLRQIAAAVAAAPEGRAILPLEGAPHLDPQQVVLLRMITPDGPIFLEAHPAPGRARGTRVRLAPMARQTREWLGQQA